MQYFVQPVLRCPLHTDHKESYDYHSYNQHVSQQRGLVVHRRASHVRHDDHKQHLDSDYDLVPQIMTSRIIKTDRGFIIIWIWNDRLAYENSLLPASLEKWFALPHLSSKALSCPPDGTIIAIHQELPLSLELASATSCLLSTRSFCDVRLSAVPRSLFRLISWRKSQTDCGRLSADWVDDIVVGETFYIKARGINCLVVVRQFLTSSYSHWHVPPRVASIPKYSRSFGPRIDVGTFVPSANRLKFCQNGSEELSKRNEEFSKRNEDLGVKNGNEES
ncbi:hypothetical protein Tco_0626871 [Tanacetum coccineum]|uniref:Uncharacterized protein n=1 Tax=Tanacetum coccineum TaxID=301880 RepID=A0ABQ4WKV6_9ASTR